MLYKLFMGKTDLENICDFFASRASETLEALADTRACVAGTTTTAVITSSSTVAGVLLNGIVRDRGIATLRFVPLPNKDSVTLSKKTGRVLHTFVVSQGFFVVHEGAP